MDGLISIPEFMAHLKKEGLVIIRADELAAAQHAELRELQRRYMRQKALKTAQVIEAKLLPLKSKEGIRHWIKDGTLRPGEAYQDEKKVWWVLTNAIKRLGYE